MRKTARELRLGRGDDRIRAVRRAAAWGAMRLSELLGLRVVTESGRSLGRVHDVRGDLTSSSVRITGLVIGTVGILERLGIGAPRTTHRIRSADVVPWPSIVRVDRRGVVVKDETTPV